MMGFSSAHRSGKTTTAKIVAERLGIPFFDGSFGKLAAELGYNSVEAMTPEARIAMQERCLALHVAKIQALPRPAITDRTPLDYLAYAMAEITMHAGVSPEVSRRVHAYAENCIEATRQNYLAIAVMKPLPVYEVEEGKPPPCLAYQHHIQLLIEAASRRVIDPVIVGHVNDGTFDLDRRVHAVAGMFAQAMQRLDAQRTNEILH